MLAFLDSPRFAGLVVGATIFITVFHALASLEPLP